MRAVPQPTGLSDLSTVLTRDMFKLAGKTSGIEQLMAIFYIAGTTTLVDPEHPDVEPPEYAHITFPEFSVKLGCPVSLAVTVLTDAENRGLIASLDPREAQRRGFETTGPAGPLQGRWYRVCPENWAKAGGYVR